MGAGGAALVAMALCFALPAWRLDALVAHSGLPTLSAAAARRWAGLRARAGDSLATARARRANRDNRAVAQRAPDQAHSIGSLLTRLEQGARARALARSLG